MTEPLRFRGRNPDVLSCIANLSNDEVFTPPDFANRMLDTVAEAWAADHGGADIWSDAGVTFLDPVTKSGVFLREIAKRLIAGLELQKPDLQARVDHILTRQVFGLAITEITALLARRSLYCSREANGKFSVASTFDDPSGHIWFERTEHSWGKGDRCTFCGASRNTLDRGEDRESHAYPFIHTDDVQAFVRDKLGDNMQFDVVIGNPPYQLASDGGTRDKPIYQHFVEQAKMLRPRYLSMVIPSRWMAGGLGLKSFREDMLGDDSVREIVDYQNAAEIFPSVGLNGGACYFLWDSEHHGACSFTTVKGGEFIGPVSRQLDKYDVLVRDNRALSILEKVQSQSPPSINSILARDKEFGFTSNFREFRKRPTSSTVPIFYIEKMKRKVGHIERVDVMKSSELIDRWKVLVPAVGSGREREKSGVDMVLGPSQIAASPSVCTQSFLFFHAETQNAAQSIQSYYATKFFRYLVSLRKISQHATHSTYAWVPMQTWDTRWTDEQLYELYNLSEQEVSFIEEAIRPMELDLFDTPTDT